MSKKILAFALAISMIVALASCGTTATTTAGATTATTTAGATTATKTTSATTTAAATTAKPTVKWPEKDLTFAIGFSAGGSSDVVTRALAQKIGEYLKVKTNCINVTGANGATAGQQVIDAKDGTVIYGGNCHNCGGWRTSGYADIGWENFYGFWAASSPYILFVNGKGSKYQTVDELVKEMKANPLKVKWGNAGLGSINHLTGEMMLDLLGCEATSIPYKGGREAAIKVMADEVAFSWAGMGDVMDLALTGEIRVLGVATNDDLKVELKNGASYTAPSLVKAYPELAKVQDLLFWGISIPRTTPPEGVAKLKEAFEYSIKQPDFIEICKSRFLDITPFIGEASDKQGAYLESVYAWGLYDNKLAAEGVSPEKFNIPKTADFKWPNDLVKTITPWP